jgi:DNA topoisomerase-1
MNQQLSGAAIRMTETNEALAAEAGLRYVHDDTPGIRRVRAGKGFRYLDPAGKTVSDAVKARIAALVIPPAWTDVWIAPTANAHLQATGRDQRGRKQYRYHDDWTALQAETKYGRLAEFGRQLPAIRRQIASDLRKHGLPKAKVVAVALQLLDSTHIRVGNEEYARDNASFGLTTLRTKHAEVDGVTIRLTFNGKGGKEWCVDYRDRRTASVVRKCQELPGQRLFQYEDEDGVLQPVQSDDINAWLRDVTGGGYTAKDFRTWSGSVIAAASLRACERPESETGQKQCIVAAVDEVAGVLGNTRAVCRASYIHPAVLEAFTSGTLEAVDLRNAGLSAADAKLLDADERFLLALLNAGRRKESTS